MKKLLHFFFLMILSWGCGPKEEPEGIVCTTNIIGDVVKELVGDSLEVAVLMGPGVDPHLYKATQGDISKLSRARVIIYNGLHLEGKMGKIFQKLETHKDVIRASDGVEQSDLINITEYEGAYDPHIWFDVALWTGAVEHISKELQKVYPHLAGYIEKKEEKYVQSLMDLDNYCQTQILSLPEKQRVLVTAHDAFKYFGRAYGIDVHGLQGISTTAEYGLRDISQLVNFITEREIRAIFVESSVPKRSVEAVIEGCHRRGHELSLGGELYSDALGDKGTPEGTYAGMLRHNVNTIVHALSGKTGETL